VIGDRKVQAIDKRSVYNTSLEWTKA
jgi:hypothetical protein